MSKAPLLRIRLAFTSANVDENLQATSQYDPNSPSGQPRLCFIGSYASEAAGRAVFLLIRPVFIDIAIGATFLIRRQRFSCWLMAAFMLSGGASRLEEPRL
jgi:hypothetical protein